MSNPFSWDHLTSVPASDDVLSIPSLLYAVVFALGFVVSSYLYYQPRAFTFTRFFRKPTIAHASLIAMWVFGIGLFFYLIRIFQINPLNFGERIWIAVMSVIAAVMLAIYALGFVRAVRRGPVARSLPPTLGRKSSSYQVSPRRRPVRRSRGRV